MTPVSLRPRTSRALASGFSLIELLLVLGAVAVLAAAAFSVYRQVQAASQAKQMVSETTAIVAGVRGLYARRSYEGLTTAVANQAGILPGSMTRTSRTTGTVYSSTGVRAYVNAYTSLSSLTLTPSGQIQPNYSFYVRFNTVPGPVCIKLVAAMANRAKGMRVGSSYPLKTDGLHMPTAAVACDAASPPTVYFYFT